MTTFLSPSPPIFGSCSCPEPGRKERISPLRLLAEFASRSGAWEGRKELISASKAPSFFPSHSFPPGRIELGDALGNSFFPSFPSSAEVSGEEGEEGEAERGLSSKTLQPSPTPTTPPPW